MTVGDRTGDASWTLYQAWRRGPSRDVAHILVTQMPVPGSVALRGRFHFLTDTAVPAMPVEMFQVSWDVWQRQVELTTRADTALVAHDVQAAETALSELQATHLPGQHRLPLVDAHIGLGDAARQADRFEEAARHYDEAMAISSEDHYRFGTIRALVPVGYLTLQAGSAQQAAETFQAAARLARELDERVYLAGALTGLGETQSRLRDDAGAMESLTEALKVCEALRADVGIVNAAQHLGDLHRRRREFNDAKAVLERALEVAQRAGPWIGVVNAADGLGEVHLGLGDVRGAVKHHQHAYQLSAERGYRRGQAHALNGLGRCAAAVAEWTVAARMHEAALDLYRQLDDLPSATTALDGMARAADALHAKEQAVQTRLAAVDAIETMRSVQDRHEYQHEYRKRFAAVYSAAVRATVAADDAAGFVAVFEALAGRRLAGLLQALPTGAAEEAQFASQMLTGAHHRPLDGGDLTDVTAAERRARLIGRLALRHGLPDTVERVLADIAAALYRPFAPDAAAPLLRRVATHTDLLLVTVLPDRDTDIAWLRAGPRASTRLGIATIPAATRDLMLTLARTGLPPDARPTDVGPLGSLLPPGILDDLNDDVPLLVVPLGPLWALPWPALSVDDKQYLGERCALTVAPSLTLADHVRSQEQPAAPRSVGQWRSPNIRYHQLLAYLDDARVDLDDLDRATDALTAITAARHDLVVVAGHGRPIPALGHYLELTGDALLTPADLLNARTPPRLVLVACWGAHAPSVPEGDPLTLATVALTRGSLAVAATTSELADDPLATTFLNGFLHRLPTEPMPVALRETTRRFLASPVYRNGYLSRWAPLITVGAAL
jgi:tetratricopeptide (TPR) repeat protein